MQNSVKLQKSHYLSSYEKLYFVNHIVKKIF